MIEETQVFGKTGVPRQDAPPSNRPQEVHFAPFKVQREEEARHWGRERPIFNNSIEILVAESAKLQLKVLERFL